MRRAGMVREATAVTDEYDLDWYDGLSDAHRAAVDKWLSRLSHGSVISVALTDESGLVGTLTTVVDDGEEETVLMVHDVHWDDPFPKDAP